MNGAAYYAYQATARGLRTSADVEALTNFMASTYRRLLSGWLPTDRSAAIYEVACGPGVMLRYLKGAGYTNVSGSDSSAEQIELARSAGLAVLQADSLQELETHEENRWDCLIAIDFIEHLPKDMLIRFLALGQRKLKPGGCLILRAPNGDSPLVGRNLFNDITHFWAYTSIATRALLGMAGFMRVELADESVAALERQRWLKVPLMKVSQRLLRLLLRAATRENVEYLSPSIYVAAWK